MKKSIKIFLIIVLSVAAFITLYIGESLYISAKVYEIVVASYNTYGENNAFQDVVSDRIYDFMCYRNGYPLSSKGRTDVKEINQLSYPTTFHWFFGGKTIYIYSYEIYDKYGECQGGSWEIPVTITVKLQKGKWVVVDYYEPP